VPIYLRGVHYDGIIDYETGTVVATIDVGLSPFGVDVTPDGSNVYVTNLNNTVSVIDTATNAVSATISVGNGPVGVAFTPDGSEAYVANQFDHTVSVVATATNTAVATVDVGSRPISYGWSMSALPRKRTAAVGPE
jgi:YVTN family beta-propeller protein